MNRFLVDEDGDIDTLCIMRCLKPQVGSDTILEDTPTHLPPDEHLFELQDILAGPLDVIPLKGSVKFDVPMYSEIAAKFEIMCRLDRKSLLK